MDVCVALALKLEIRWSWKREREEKMLFATALSLHAVDADVGVSSVFFPHDYVTSFILNSTPILSFSSFLLLVSFVYKTRFPSPSQNFHSKIQIKESREKRELVVLGI